MAETLAVELLLEQLVAEGTRFIFGNPGATERPLMEALSRRSDLRFILGLDQGIPVSMAMGYAQASGRAGVVSLHAEPGLAGGLAALSNARYSRVPLVVLGGQQDSRLLNEDLPACAELCKLAEPFCKWTGEL